MEDTIQSIRLFFEQYKHRFNNALSGGELDVEGTVNAFSSCFIAANPVGVTCGHNDENFKVAVPQGYAYYSGIGINSMDIVTIDTTLLDDFHAMAKVRWRSAYRKRDMSGLVEFENFYFLQTKGNEIKIFAYITGNEQSALRQIGLIQ